MTDTAPTSAAADLIAAPQEALQAAPDQSPVQVVTDPNAPPLSPSQAQQMADALLAAGVPADQVHAALTADGGEVPTEDTRTDEQREFDGMFGAASAADYHVNFMGRTPAGMSTEALAQANAELTANAAAIGFPSGVGEEVIERSMDMGQAVGRLTEPQRAMWKQEQAAAFERMSGSAERAVERKAFAARALERANPAWVAALHKSGALDDAGIVAHLANQGERIAARG